VKEEVQRKMIKDYLVRFPTSAMEAKSKGTAWNLVPFTYIRTTQDMAVPPLYQDLMLKRVEEQGVSYVEKKYETSHSVFITKQDEMVRDVVEAANDVRNPV